MFRLCVTLVVLNCALVAFVAGHGMMIDPPGRASRWRFNSSAPINYNDNELFCGGFTTQWTVNDGKCGLCGDDYRLEAPRPHEIGGFYGEGIIVNTFKSGETAFVSIIITANHRGYFTFDLCNIDKEAESDECFAKNPLKLTDGEDKYYVPTYTPDQYNMTLQLPSELECEHCVLRWTYRAGNNWGNCDDGSVGMGCGPQEHFRSCADIQISQTTEQLETPLEVTVPILSFL